MEVNDKLLLTRRGGLTKGARLAFVAPAVVAGLRAGVVHADSGSGHQGSQHVDTHDSDTSTKHEVAGAQTQDVSTRDDATTDTTTNLSQSNTTTRVAGERTDVVVLGRARLCRQAGNQHLPGAGQLRLVRSATGVHLNIRIRGAGNSSVTFADSPGDVLNNTVLQLTGGRGTMLNLSDAVVSKLVTAGSKDFADGFSFQIKVGNDVRTFVVCPDRR
jgi:hypothetical protein